MRPIVRFASAFLIALVIAACHQQSAQTTSATPQGHAPATPPNSATDDTAWEAYMVKISHADLKGITAKPYLFEVLAKNDPRASQRNPQIQQALTQMAKTDQFPGNAIAVAGPDPDATADVVVAALDTAKAGSLNGLTVLYIGAAQDKARVQKAVAASGATFRFVAM